MSDSPPNFSGTWQLDSKASQIPELLMELQNASWMERKAASLMSPTQIIVQQADRVDITVKSPLVNRTETLLLNGEPQTKTTRRVGEVVVSSSWEGATLVTHSQMNTPKGEVKTISRRRLDPDQQTITVELEVIAPDGRQQTTNRVFRRVSD